MHHTCDTHLPPRHTRTLNLRPVCLIPAPLPPCPPLPQSSAKLIPAPFLPAPLPPLQVSSLLRRFNNLFGIPSRIRSLVAEGDLQQVWGRGVDEGCWWPRECGLIRAFVTILSFGLAQDA